MIKLFGKQENYKIVSKDGNLWTIRWGWEPWKDEEGKEIDMGYWSEHPFFSKPNINEVRQLILNAINSDTDYKILTGFNWEVPVEGELAEGEEPLRINCYLSTENQFNYKAAYDLAHQTQGASLPFVLKFGSDEAPKYYEFKTLEEFSGFYQAAIGFINATLQEGWIKKDGIDWAEYERQLNEING